eukprot:241561_1
MVSRIFSTQKNRLKLFHNVFSIMNGHPPPELDLCLKDIYHLDPSVKFDIEYFPKETFLYQFQKLDPFPTNEYQVGYWDQWPIPAHYNMSNILNMAAKHPFICEKSQWIISSSFQQKYGLSVLSGLEIHDTTQQIASSRSNWLYFKKLPTKYKSFKDCMGNNLPYLIRKETSQQLIIYRDIHANPQNAENLRHIFDLYEPDSIILETAANPQIFKDVLNLDDSDILENLPEGMHYIELDESHPSNIPVFGRDTAIQYAIENNKTLVLADFHDHLKDYLRTFARYFDCFQSEKFKKEEFDEWNKTLLQLYIVANMVLFGHNGLANQFDDFSAERQITKEFAEQIVRYWSPHQHMYSSYRDEFIAYCIDQCGSVANQNNSRGKTCGYFG